MASFCGYGIPKLLMQPIGIKIPCIFNHWAVPVVHLLLLMISMAWPFFQLEKFDRKYGKILWSMYLVHTYRQNDPSYLIVLLGMERPSEVGWEWCPNIWGSMVRILSPEYSQQKEIKNLTGKVFLLNFPKTLKNTFLSNNSTLSRALDCKTQFLQF